MRGEGGGHTCVHADCVRRVLSAAELGAVASARPDVLGALLASPSRAKELRRPAALAPSATPLVPPSPRVLTVVDAWGRLRQRGAAQAPGARTGRELLLLEALRQRGAASGVGDGPASARFVRRAKLSPRSRDEPLCLGVPRGPAPPARPRTSQTPSARVRSVMTRPETGTGPRVNVVGSGLLALHRAYTPPAEGALTGAVDLAVAALAAAERGARVPPMPDAPPAAAGPERSPRVTVQFADASALTVWMRQLGVASAALQPLMELT